ncbi:MAG: EAL domain-containing protein [Thermodesulfobacteriota bacterium]|nr:EAL domain-containing protein [Thermodesulfobacteriota bacterium]
MDQNGKEPGVEWCLESASDSGNKWIVPIKPIPFTIGRSQDCDLTLLSKGTSRRHAQINISGSMLWIRDLGSTNGTFLNRKRITEAETLEPGDIIHFGNVLFSVRMIDPIHVGIRDTTETLLFGTSEILNNNLKSYAPEFKKMLQNRTVVPYFQPILDLSDNRIVGYEILGRIPKECKLPPNPIDLFNIAVSLDLEFELSSLFREEGIRQGIKLPGTPNLFMNTHPIELFQIDELEKSLKKISEFSLKNAIILEISEKAITDLKEMKRLSAALKELNIGLAYDDFGSGQARLIELAEFPPDFLKFDASIVRNIHLAPRRLHQLIDTFLNISHDIGILTVAEGVECLEEGKTCKQLGFDCVQGNFFGYPLPIDNY